MEQRNVNPPWTWQDQWGFSQAVLVTNPERVLYCAGQISTDEDGSTLHVDDMRAQTVQAFDNLETVLRHAGMALANVARLNYYVTDVDRVLSEGAAAVGERLGPAGVHPATTLLGVQRLAFPDLLIEIEATALG